VDTLRVGWVGAGVMGSHMCGHVLAGGFPVVVHTRTKARAEHLVGSGARWADTPADVVAQSDVVFTIVGLPGDVRDVYLGPRGLLGAARRGQIFVDMTTSQPALAQQLAAAADAMGALALDAPVSGGDVGARNAALSIMVGGDRRAFDTVVPVLNTMGKRIVHLGGPGSGQHTKMCNQIVIAGTMVGVCESLLYGYRAGLDLPSIVACIRSGAAGCWSLDNYGPRILGRDFAPGFFVEHFIKDLGIALAEAERMGIALPGLALAHQLYLLTRARGHGRLGVQALMLTLEEITRVSAAEGSESAGHGAFA
jgi:3-hydroxyisobutyrate dehydrogenase